MTLSPTQRTTPRLDVGEQPHPLPLPALGWGVLQALAALDVARPHLPLRLPENVRVVSSLTSVVLRAGGHAVKIYPPGTCATRLNELSSRLAGSLTAHLAEPGAVATEHGVVTVARWLTCRGEVSWQELGTLLRRFHTEHDRTDLPVWVPLTRLQSQVAGLPVEYAGVLLEARRTLLTALGELPTVLGHGVIHGDLSTSNVMRTSEGLRLIDLDWAGVGPREYDLASAARRVDAGQLDPGEYQTFCDTYGFDVRGWPGLAVLNRIAGLGGVAFRLWDDRRHGRSLDWVPDEVMLWRKPL